MKPTLDSEWRVFKASMKLAGNLSDSSIALCKASFYGGAAVAYLSTAREQGIKLATPIYTELREYHAAIGRGDQEAML